MRAFVRVMLLNLMLMAHSAVSAPPELDRQLYDAVMYMDAASVRGLLAKGADANLVEGNRSLLGWAAQNGSVPVVEALLAAQADPNFVDGVGQTPLMRALDMQQTPVVAALLKAKPDLGIRTGNGKTAAMLAVESGKAQLVRLLLEAGADFNATDEEGDSPALMAAQGYGDEMFAIVRLLGTHQVDMNKSNAAYTALIFAIEQENAHLVTTLLKAGADPNAPSAGGTLPLSAALYQPSMVKRLLAAGADPNAKGGNGRPLLFEAMDSGSVQTVDALIKAGADVNATDAGGRTPLAYAESLYRSDMVEALKAGGASGGGEAVADGGETASSPGAGSAQSEYAALPKIQVVQEMQGSGSEVVYFSGASVREIAEFYRSDLAGQGWQAGDAQTDDRNYAVIYFSRGAERLSLSLSLESGRTPERVLVDLVPHGSLRVPDLPRYPGTTVLFEQDSIAIYVTADPVAKVATATMDLLGQAGWQGKLTAETPQMRHLTFIRDGNELTAQISVAPAQGNKTTIQYSLREL